MSDVYLTSKQVAERVGVREDTLCDWRRMGKGPAFIRRGGRIYYSLTEVENWYRNGEAEPSIANNSQRQPQNTKVNGLRLTG